MPTEWVWTNRQLGRSASHVYLVYPSDLSDDRLGAMKVFSSGDKLAIARAKQELLALRALDGNLNFSCPLTSCSRSATVFSGSSRSVRLPKQCV
jgi:hypothetical protein